MATATGTTSATDGETTAAADGADTYLEIELKLEADPSFVLPDLAGLPGVTSVEDAQLQELEAVYLDSADLRLARHGTTFRRRTGGTDAGWHLKLPAAKQGRIEVRRAPGRMAGLRPPSSSKHLYVGRDTSQLFAGIDRQVPGC
jgi:hypothetical protein